MDEDERRTHDASLPEQASRADPFRTAKRLPRTSLTRKIMRAPRSNCAKERATPRFAQKSGIVSPTTRVMLSRSRAMAPPLFATRPRDRSPHP
ncbi:protein of unknown function [Ralstonia solanacearum CMR15]|nr:protein of unknown function [Ralstonia solanacearum CMR15]